jgi:hypothetical protein
VGLTTHLRLVPRSRMSGAVPPLPLYVFMAWCLVKHSDKFTFYTSSSRGTWLSTGKTLSRLNCYHVMGTCYLYYEGDKLVSGPITCQLLDATCPICKYAEFRRIIFQRVDRRNSCDDAQSQSRTAVRESHSLLHGFLFSFRTIYI